MAQQFIRYKNFDGLLNAYTSDFLMQDNELAACKNVWAYSLGTLEKCSGYSKASTTQVIDNASVNYLHHYYQPSSKVDRLLACSDSGLDYVIEYRTTGDWAAITSGTHAGRAGAEVDMENFIDKVFVVGYDAGTFLTNATITGTTMATSDGTNLTDMAQGKYIIRYKDLLYVLHCYSGATLYPSRVYYSSTPTAGAITWTPATDFIEFGYDDGDEITGGVEALDRLIVFKHYSMWKYDESERKKIADVGCDSYRSIIKIDQIPYWTNRFGAWRWRGAAPELISAKAQPFFDAIDQTTLGNQVATVYNGFEYRVFIGTVTVKGYTYTNAWWCWDTRREKCYIRCTHDVAKSACTYIEDQDNVNKQRAYFGNDDGYVFKFADKIDEIYADDGNEIDNFFITKNFDYGVPEDVKFASNMTTFTENAAGMKVAVDADYKDQFSEDNKQIRSNIDHLSIASSGNLVKFKFYEKGSGKSWKFNGFIIGVDIKEQA